MFLTKQNKAIKISWLDGGWRGDRFCFCSFGTSWRLWENSRHRHVQVGIREGLKTIEPGLMEHKMESCEDVFGPQWLGEKLFHIYAMMPITTHLYSTFRQKQADAGVWTPTRWKKTHLFSIIEILELGRNVTVSWYDNTSITSLRYDIFCDVKHKDLGKNVVTISVK